MNKERFVFSVCLCLILIISLSFVFGASSAKIDGVVKFRGYQYFAFSNGERSGIYIDGNKEIYLQRPSFGGMATDYFVFDKKIGIVNNDPLGNFILLDSSLKDFIGEYLFSQIDGREITEEGLVGEQTESVELMINKNGNQIDSGIIIDGRGYLRPKNNLKETIGKIDKTGKISMYNPSSYSSSIKTSLAKTADLIHNTKATNGKINDLTKISNDGYDSRSASARTAQTSSGNVIDRVRRAAGEVIDKITGRNPSPKPSPTPKPGPIPPGEKPSPKPTNKTAPASKPKLGKPNVVQDINCEYEDGKVRANPTQKCGCETTLAFMKANGYCKDDPIEDEPEAYQTFTCRKPNGAVNQKMVWTGPDVDNCCKKDADCVNKYPGEYPICNTDKGQCMKKCPPEKK
jgi:hypothetical protein